MIAIKLHSAEIRIPSNYQLSNRVIGIEVSKLVLIILYDGISTHSNNICIKVPLGNALGNAFDTIAYQYLVTSMNGHI